MSWKVESKIPTFMYIHYDKSINEYTCNIIKGNAEKHDDLWASFIACTDDLRNKKTFEKAEKLLKELKNYYIINWKLDKKSSDYNLHTIHIQPSDNIILLNI